MFSGRPSVSACVRPSVRAVHPVGTVILEWVVA